MNIKPKGTVILPRSPRKGVELLPWCKEVNKSLQQLRDRIWTVPTGPKKSAAASHPWKCSPNGDDTIAYPADGVYTYRAPSLARPVYSVIVAATAGDVTITDNGWLYIKVATTPTNFLSSGQAVQIDAGGTGHILTLDVMLADSLSVVFNTAAPSTINETAETGAIFIPICEVALTDNIASIVKQWLTYNPPVPVYVNDIS